MKSLAHLKKRKSKLIKTSYYILKSFSLKLTIKKDLGFTLDSPPQTVLYL